MAKKHVIFLTFANDREEPSQYLKALDTERSSLQRILDSYQENGWGTYYAAVSSQPNELKEDLNRFSGRLLVFHYAGHADGTELQLEGEKGDAIPFAGENLLSFLTEEAQLKLVFLNACATGDHVKRLFSIGIPAVVATEISVGDTQAKDFAKSFYTDLVNGKSLQTAFASAKAVVSPNDKVNRIYRKMDWNHRDSSDSFPWKLYVQDDSILTWRLTDSVPKVASDKAIPNFQTPFPSPAEKIIGREADIENLQHELIHSKLPVLLTGMGGIGKSRLAIEYINRFKGEYDYIIWIEQLSTLTADLTSNSALNQVLKFQPSSDLVANCQAILFQLSQLAGKLLLVIDNINEEIEDYANYLPKAPHSHVLLSSRKELEFARIVRLGFLDEAFAMKLFYAHYKRERDDDIVSFILMTIDFHTLTIELISKTAYRRKIGLSKLKELIEERGLALGRRADDVKLLRDPNRKLKRILPFLEMVFDIGGLEEEEKKLLQKLAALPSTTLSLTLLAYLLKIEPEEEETWDDFIFTLSQLTEKGWLILDESPKEDIASKKKDESYKQIESKNEIESREEAYKMHRVIQDVVWKQLNPSFESVKELFGQVKSLLEIDQSKDNPVEKFLFVPFGERLLMLFPEEECRNIALLKNNLATIYIYVGRFNEACIQYEEVIAWLKKASEKEIENMAFVQSNLAKVHKESGDYEKAAELLEKALEADIRNFGEEHPNVALFQSNLALVYKDIGRYDQAVELLEKALESDIRNFGEEHPNVAIKQSNLAIVYQDLGRYEKAAELLEKALESDLRIFGEKHPNVALYQSNLATAYKALGSYDQAAELLEKALESDIRNFGEAHPNVARIQSNLATVYQDLGRYDQAVELLEKALESDIKNFGEEHPRVAIKQSNLALVYKALGHYNQASELLEKALESDIRNFGEEHPNVALFQSNLALVYKDIGRYDQAAELLEKTLESDRRNFKEAHPAVAISQSNLAYVYLDLGRKEEAKALFKSAYQIMLTILGPDHPDTHNTKKALENL